MDLLSRPASEFGNDEAVEKLWATNACEHAEIYFNLISSVDPRYLKITPNDDVIYTTFRQDFPNLKIGIVTDEDLKNPREKIKWRHFIEKFSWIHDSNIGTLLRQDASQGFTPNNSILVVRIQFYAIEIARNREGFNDNLRKLFRDSYNNHKLIL